VRNKAGTAESGDLSIEPPGSSNDGSDVVAQCQSFANKMPVFYGAIVACMVAQVVVLYQELPLFQSTVLPMSIALIAAVRMVWWRRRRQRPFTEEQAAAELARSSGILLASTAVIIAVDLGAIFSVSADARTFLLIEAFGCTMVGVYCMMHLRYVPYVMAAMLLSVVVVTSSIFDTVGFAGIAIAIGSLLAAMLSTMRGYYRDFQSMTRAVRESQALSLENLRLAGLDVLTDLPNRRRFFQDLQALCVADPHGENKLAVGVADLDGFKPINDTHGHAVGDRLLKQVACRLLSIFPQGRFYRIGGDEFAFIINVSDAPREVVAISDRLIQLASQPFMIGDLMVRVGCSVGVCIYPDSADAAELLYERADYALFHAKRSGRGCSRIFNAEDEQQLRRHGAIEQAFLGADIEKEFYPVYQPIVSSENGEIRVLECLARWNSPSLGTVSPGEFIPILENSGLIWTLTPMLLSRALRDATAWPEHTRLAFNLSAVELGSSERARDLIDILRSSDFPPERVEFELTETAVIRDFEQTSKCLSLLKSAGVKISLDDFGTGYSNLNQIHKLPLDKIKIDQAFVRSLAPNDSRRTIISLIISMCRELKLSCVVEGVETEDQYALLADLGCEQMQGYLFSRPVEAANTLPLFTRTAPHAGRSGQPTDFCR